jgi:hypothetical protein
VIKSAKIFQFLSQASPEQGTLRSACDKIWQIPPIFITGKTRIRGFLELL